MPQRKSWHHTTESRHARGYGTAWDKLRLVVLQRDLYLCQCDECRKAQRITPANEVDHHIPKDLGGTDDLSNLRSINHECHKRKTGRENAARRGYARPKVGLDGVPEGWGGIDVQSVDRLRTAARTSVCTGTLHAPQGSPCRR